MDDNNKLIINKEKRVVQASDEKPIFVCSNNNDQLICFTCGDESLYHDSYAWWDDDNDDLICGPCYIKKGSDSIEKYKKVVTFH